MMNIINVSGKRKYALILAFCFALSCVLGYRLKRYGYTCRTALEWVEMLLALFIVTIVSYIFTRILFSFLTWLRDGERKSRILKKEYTDLQAFFFYAGVILLFWFPVFLAYYPSVFAYDAEMQFYQFLAHDYSTHHPLIHTLFLGLFFKLGAAVFGSYSVGMALHSIV